MSQSDREPETVTKIDAARRQLATALELWFNDGDSVSIYTLAHAAYEVIHGLTRPDRNRDLLFDSLVIKDEFRKEYINHLKAPANFFKHATSGTNADQRITFYPLVSEQFFLFSILGLQLVKLPTNDHEQTFELWFAYNREKFLTANGRKHFRIDGLPIETVEHIRGMSKREFFQHVMHARRAKTTPDWQAGLNASSSVR